MISRRSNFRTGLALGAILMIGIAIFLNRTASNVSLGRFDLTEGRIYTVSDGAKKILGNLPVPVQVRYYVTPAEEMPAGLKTLRQEVTDKLTELSIASKGKMQFQIVDPTETEELQEALQTKGVRPFQVQSVERDAVAVKLVYSSLSVGYKDANEEVIPQVLPDNLGSLEYELLSRVTKLVRTEQPVVAIHSTKEPMDPQMMSFYLQSGQPLPEQRDPFAPIPEYLRSEGYDVRQVELTETSPVPPEAKALLLLGVREMNERQRWEVHQVLKRGGSVIIATQASLYDYNPAPQGGFQIGVRSQALGVNDLTSAYGVRIDDRLLMDEQMATLAIPRTAVIGGLRFQMSEPVQAPMQIRVLGESIRRDLPFTAGVSELLYLWGNQVIVDDAGITQKGLKATPVFTGSPKAWVVEKTEGMLEAADLDPAGHPMLENPTLAVLVEGTFPDPWSGGPAPSWSGGPVDPMNPGATTDPVPPPAATAPDTGAAAAAAASPDSASQGRLLVIGCQKLFEEMLLEQAGHALLLLNAVDALSLGEELISIRSRNIEARTFGEVSDGKKLAFRIVNMALVPVLLVGLGLGGRFRRRRDAEEYANRMARNAEGSDR